MNLVTWQLIYQVLSFSPLFFCNILQFLPSYLNLLYYIGHGQSSHIADGYYYHTPDFISVVEEIRQKYDWKKVSLIGHSMGALVSFLYAAIYNKNVDLVCALDTIKPLAPNAKESAKSLLESWEKSFYVFQRNQDKNQKPPEYTYDELIERVYAGSMGSVNRDKAKYLIERGVNESSNDPNKFYFSRDIRVKYMQKLFLDQNVTLEHIKRIQAAYLFVRGDDAVFSESAKNIFQAVDVFRHYNQNFDMIKIIGTHHLHLNHPELIGDKISEFLLKHHVQEPNDRISV